MRKFSLRRAGIPSRMLARIGAVAALGIFFAVMLYLSILSLLETVDMNMENSMQENAVFHYDSFLWGIVTLLLGVALLLLCRRLLARVNVWIPVAVSIAFVLIMGTVWVFSSQSAPTHDSLIVSRAAYHATQGDYSRLTSDYFQRFPFQLGYVLFSELIIRICGTGENYLSVEVVNVVCLAISYFARLMTVRRIFKNDNTVKILALLLILCVQPILFCTFTYGNIPGLAFAALAMWQFSEIRPTARGWLHAVLCALCIGVSVCIKKNFMIVLAALLIIGVIRLITSRRLADLVCLVLCVASVLALPAAVQSHYEKRTDFDFGKGIPMVSWLAMGLNESHIAPGWYNGKYTVTNFHSHDMDPDAAAEASMEVIKERIRFFEENEQYTRDFFAKKIASQWNEPTYQSIWTNQVRGRYEEPGKLAAWVMGEGEDDVKAYMNAFQQMIFVLSAAGAILMIRRRRIELVLLPTVILGGFFYHALFEAKSQYAITYFVLMLPVAAYALNVLYLMIGSAWKGRNQN